jgi:hypothetical protein
LPIRSLIKAKERLNFLQHIEIQFYFLKSAANIEFVIRAGAAGSAAGCAAVPVADAGGAAAS